MSENQPPETPKIDLKMMILPLIFLLQKQIDFKNEEILNYVRIGLLTSALIGLGTYFFIKQQINNQNNNKKIFIPPKTPPQIPFLSPPPEPIKSEDYIETTYKEHENKLIMEAIQGVIMSCGIAALMSFKFNIHMSCLMQALMVPIGIYDNILVKKYILGSKQENLYNELFARPNSNNTATTTTTTSTKKKNDDSDDDNRPRVEELDEEPVPTPTKKEEEVKDVHDID